MVASGGPGHPGVHGVVGLVAQPPVPVRLGGIGLPATGEGGVFVTEAGRVFMPRPDVLGRRGVPVIADRVFDPPPGREELPGLRQIGCRRRVVLDVRHQVRVVEQGDQHLVEVRLEGKSRGRSDGNDAVVPAGHPCPAMAPGEEQPDARRRSQRPGEPGVTEPVPRQGGGAGGETPEGERASRRAQEPVRGPERIPGTCSRLGTRLGIVVAGLARSGFPRRAVVRRAGIGRRGCGHSPSPFHPGHGRFPTAICRVLDSHSQGPMACFRRPPAGNCRRRAADGHCFHQSHRSWVLGPWCPSGTMSMILGWRPR